MMVVASFFLVVASFFFWLLPPFFLVVASFFFWLLPLFFFWLLPPFFFLVVASFFLVAASFFFGCCLLFFWLLPPFFLVVCCGCASMGGCSATMWELRSLFLVIGLLHIIGLLFSYLCHVFVCAVFRLVELLGPPTASLAYQARVYCGCKPGPTRVLPMPRQYGIGRRAPALRTLATSYDFKETWFIDVSSCTPPRPGRVYDLVDFGSTSVERSHPPLHS